MNKEKDPFSLEASLKEIKEILDKMRENQTDFDRNVQLFRKGTDLIKESRAYLDSSELLLKRLIDDGNGVKEVEEG